MANDYDNLINCGIADVHQVYSDRDTILYSLGLGIGSDPHAPNQLRHVYEKNLVPFPSMAVVLATGGSWSREPGTGITYAQVLHAEQHFEIIRPFPAHGRSEEHTSELQSLMRISSAVFCFKKTILCNATTHILTFIHITIP